MNKTIKYAGVAICLMIGPSVTGIASAQGAGAGAMKDEVEHSQKAAQTFREIMTTDNGIPKSLLDKAECVAVFPGVIKAAFGIGGRGGHGEMSCRTAKGWSTPAFLEMGGGSVGFQIGVESTDYVMLFMTSNSAHSLLSSKVTLGGNASVAAGPVGRQAEAATDVKLNAEILSYSRSKGAFAGVSLEGATVQIDDSAMHKVYGAAAKADDVISGKVNSVAAVDALPKELARHSSRREAMPTSGQR